MLAPRRVAALFASRAVGNPSDAHANLRQLKHMGVVGEPPSASPTGVVRSVRVQASRPRPGYHHPASVAAVSAFLATLGPEWTYGVRTVRLVQAPPAGTALRFGELRVPGEVLLFEQPATPWRLPRTLAAADRQRLESAGALVEADAGGLTTLVGWPGETLSDFMLCDVLAHELAHHRQQQYAGKRPVRVRRTRDHEALAHLQVRRFTIRQREGGRP